MFTVIRHSPHRIRSWLIAIAAILLITSILEAGHGHGVFTPQDDHCALCQHSIALDKTLLSSIGFVTPLLLIILVYICSTRVTPTLTRRFALIRAPPQLLQQH